MLVVGGAGFLGSHLVDRPARRGHAVDVVDDLSSGSLTTSPTPVARGAALKIHTRRHPSADGLAVSRIRAPERRVPPRPARRRATPGHGRDGRDGVAPQAMLPVLEAARTPAPARSSSLCRRASRLRHGRPGPSCPVKEVDRTGAAWTRGVAAAAIVECCSSTTVTTHGVEFTALAMSTVYGPRQRPDGGSRRCDSSLPRSRVEPPTFDGDGRQTRDLLYVDDAVDAPRAGGIEGRRAGRQRRHRRADVDPRPVGRDRPRRTCSGDRSPTPGRAHPLRPLPVRARIHLAWSSWTSVEDGLALLEGGKETFPPVDGPI